MHFRFKDTEIVSERMGGKSNHKKICKGHKNIIQSHFLNMRYHVTGDSSYPTEYTQIIKISLF